MFDVTGERAMLSAGDAARAAATHLASRGMEEETRKRAEALRQRQRGTPSTSLISVYLLADPSIKIHIRPFKRGFVHLYAYPST